MALIKIENATVKRHHGANGAFIIEEPADPENGRLYPASYTVWHKGQAPAVDSIVTVTGIYSHKKQPYGEGIIVNVNVNNPQITQAQAAQPAPVSQPVTLDEAPF